MTASGDTTERWAEKMMQREYGETPPRRPVRVQAQGQGQDSWASKMMEREYGGSTEIQHNHPPVREYQVSVAILTSWVHVLIHVHDQATRRIQEEIEVDFVTPVSKVKKYAQTPRREFSKPPKEFSKPPRAFSQFPSEFSKSPSEFSQPPREYNSLLPTQASLQDSVNFGKWQNNQISIIQLSSYTTKNYFKKPCTYGGHQGLTNATKKPLNTYISI